MSTSLAEIIAKSDRVFGIVDKPKKEEESTKDHQSEAVNNQKIINFIRDSEMLRSEINKTTDPMKALDLSLRCVSIYLDDNGFFYQSNKNRLIGGS